MAIPKTASTKKAISPKRFAPSRLIQNLGTKKEQYSFQGNVRTVHGRD
tara:strand:- start:499 stop:642 length:144 start_codon:yes stop_codon:yes gene_type:complete